MNAIVTAWQYAELAAHEPKNSTDSPLLEDSTFTPMENDIDYGYIAEFSDKIIISFEGTKNLKAWISDFMAYPMRNWGDTLVHTKTGEKGTIHRGFYEAWSYFKPVVENYLLSFNSFNKAICGQMWKEKGHPPIYVYAHSRGGDIGLLCARHIAKNLGVPCSCITFGAAALGNKECREEFNLLPINCTDVTHGYEFTLDLPPRWAGFRRMGRGLWLPESAWHKYFHKIRDHYYSTTTKALMPYVGDDAEAIAALEVVLSQVKF